jgi:hypothetical protein
MVAEWSINVIEVEVVLQCIDGLYISLLHLCETYHLGFGSIGQLPYWYYVFSFKRHRDKALIYQNLTTRFCFLNQRGSRGSVTLFSIIEPIRPLVHGSLISTSFISPSNMGPISLEPEHNPLTSRFYRTMSWYLHSQAGKGDLTKVLSIIHSEQDMKRNTSGYQLSSGNQGCCSG